MKTLSNHVNIIPIIAKADVLNPSELESFKNRIAEDLATAKIPIFDFQKFVSAENLSSVIYHLF
jgi:septin family protein